MLLKNILITILIHFVSYSIVIAQTDPGRIVTGTVFPGLAGSEANYIKAPQPFSPADLKPEVNYDTSIDATVDRDTDSGDLYNGKPSWNCTFDALNDWCEFYTTPIPLDGQTGNCEASVWYKSATDNTLEVRSSSDLIAAQSLPAVSTWTKASLVTSCGSSRKIRLVGGAAGSINHVVSWSKKISPVPVNMDYCIPWTPTGTWTSNTTYKGTACRSGAYAYFNVDVTASSAPNANTELNINLPSGWVVDAAKLAQGSITDNQRFGTGSVLVTAAANRYLMLTALKSSTAFRPITSSDGSSGYLGNNSPVDSTGVPGSWGSGGVVSFVAERVPIVGWDQPQLGYLNTLDVLGTPVFSPTDTCPAGSIAADGSAFPTGSQYAQLKAKLGNPTNLPDWRGLAPAFSGSQTLSGVVHDGGSPGDKQNDRMQGHRHNTQVNGVSALMATGSGAGGTYAAGSRGEVAVTTTGEPVTDGTNGTPRLGTTTRMANVRFKPCISYANTPAPFIPNMVTSSADKPVHDWISFTCSASSSVANGSTNDWLTVGNATDTGNTRTCAVTFAQAYTERPGCQITSIVGSDTSLIAFDVGIFNFTASGFTMVGPDFDYYGVISCTGKR